MKKGIALVGLFNILFSVVGVHTDNALKFPVHLNQKQSPGATHRAGLLLPIRSMLREEMPLALVVLRQAS
ncbi:hypothetical protein [Chryseolinea soli]|uniref:Uncharacterized protein n=1 Tax=Chryseolinea soli TaxID=2321403 RepID=A0A385SF37_9BACT|nr:hypothetical protein [Chryseolinea soli]AYB29512.1 hypothetical protein D4L85_02445 [Chryseolinea soli]